MQTIFAIPSTCADKIAVLLTCCILGGAAPSAASTSDVLALCLDTSMTPEGRTDQLLEDGWQRTGSPIDALAVALTLTRMNPGEPENWNATRERSTVSAASMRDPGTFLSSPDGRYAVFFGRDRTGLQTCLFLGDSPDLGPLDDALDGSIIRTIGEVSRIRGDGVKSLISAHAITEDGRALFDPRLQYGLTFTVVLDRQPGDLR